MPGIIFSQQSASPPQTFTSILPISALTTPLYTLCDPPFFIFLFLSLGLISFIPYFRALLFSSETRKKRFYFVVALHYDIGVVAWSILSVIVWIQLFYSWVYPEESEHARIVYRNGSSILEVQFYLGCRCRPLRQYDR